MTLVAAAAKIINDTIRQVARCPICHAKPGEFCMGAYRPTIEMHGRRRDVANQVRATEPEKYAAAYAQNESRILGLYLRDRSQ